MKVALEVKNKWGIIDGIVAIPATDSPQFTAWKRCNGIVKLWLLKTLSLSIAQSVLYFQNAKEIWEDLKNKFSQGDPHRISDLQDEIYNQKQGVSSVTNYYTCCKIPWGRDECSETSSSL